MTDDRLRALSPKTWLDPLKADIVYRTSYQNYLQQRRTQLNAELADERNGWNEVQKLRGQLEEIDRLERLLTSEEKEDAARRSYDQRAAAG